MKFILVMAVVATAMLLGLRYVGLGSGIPELDRWVGLLMASISAVLPPFRV